MKPKQGEKQIELTRGQYFRTVCTQVKMYFKCIMIVIDLAVGRYTSDQAVERKKWISI